MQSRDFARSAAPCCGLLLVLSDLAAGGSMASGSETTKLLAADGAANHKFGLSVAVDGTTAIVGAGGADLGAGAAYLFDTTTGAQLWKLQASDGAPSDRFGISVAIRGPVAIVGADLDDDQGSASGAAYLFDTSTGAQLHKLTPDDGALEDYFGYAVATDGTTAIVGAFGDDDQGSISGSAYLFDVATGSQLAKLLPGDGAADDVFGYSVGVSGTRAIVGAFGDDDNGPFTGSAYLFDTTTGLQVAKLLPAGGVSNEFGVSVAIDGETAVIGAWYDDENGMDAGAAYVFDTSPPAQVARLLPGDGAALDHFGYTVSVSGGTALISGHSNDDNGSQSGSAYLFDTSTGDELEKLLPGDGSMGDLFGVSVGISGPTAIVGAHLDADNGVASGSAYLFCAPPVTYCAAGVSASGCQAAISASGTSSASAPSGFTLLAADLEGGKDGLFFFGVNGRQSNAWGNGTSLQCVVPPVMRAGLLAGAGTSGACDGVLSQDLNARWTAKPGQNPGVGALVQAQLWYRDPFSTSNQTTSLSDAIEFCVSP